MNVTRMTLRLDEGGHLWDLPDLFLKRKISLCVIIYPHIWGSGIVGVLAELDEIN